MFRALHRSSLARTRHHHSFKAPKMPERDTRSKEVPVSSNPATETVRVDLRHIAVYQLVLRGMLRYAGSENH